MDGQDPNNNANAGNFNGAPEDNQQPAENQFVNFDAANDYNQDDGQQPGMAANGVMGGGAGAGGEGDDENADYFDDGGETFLPADHVSRYCNRLFNQVLNASNFHFSPS